MSWIANAVAFQLCWMAFVGGAAHGQWWLGFAVLAPFAAWQLRASRQQRADVILLVLAAVLGFVLDSLLAAAGLLRYASPVPSIHLAPLWIVGLWMGFALTINHSMAFLHNRVLLASVLGAVAGPLAYWIAARIWSALTIADPTWPALLALAVAWAVMTPLLAQIAVRLTRPAPAAPVLS